MIAIATVIACYFLALLAMSLLARPARLRMRDAAEVLLNRDLTAWQERYVHELLKTAYSIREAPILTLSFLRFLLTPIERIEHDLQEMDLNADFWDQPEMTTLIINHTRSVAAANPLFGLTLYVARWASTVKLSAFYRGRETAAVRNRVDAKLALT